MRTFKFTAPLENLVLSWVRCVVGDDCVEILRVVFKTTHAKLEIFLAFTTLKIKIKKTFSTSALHFKLSPSQCLECSACLSYFG